MLLKRVVARNVDGLTHDDSLAPAAGDGNTANWILGHLVNVQNEVVKLIGAPPGVGEQAASARTLRASDPPRLRGHRLGATRGALQRVA